MTEISVDGLRNGCAIIFVAICVISLMLLKTNAMLERIATALEAMIPDEVEDDDE